MAPWINFLALPLVVCKYNIVSGWTDNTLFFFFHVFGFLSCQSCCKTGGHISIGMNKAWLLGHIVFVNRQEWLVPAMRFFRIQGNSAFRHRFLNKDNVSVQVILVSTSSLNDTTRIGQRLNVEMIPKRNTTFRIDNTPHFLLSMFRELKNVSPFWFYLIQVIKYIWWSVESERQNSV